MDDPIIQVRIIRGGRFHKEVDVLWPDGAVTELTRRKCLLHGTDGKDYPVGKSGEHRLVCEGLMREQGYSLKKR